MSSDVDVTYDGDSDRNRLAIRHESGIRIEIEADEKKHLKVLQEEIFGDPDTLAGAVYRSVIEAETESGMTAAEVIEAARDRYDDRN